MAIIGWSGWLFNYLQNYYNFGRKHEGKKMSKVESQDPFDFTYSYQQVLKIRTWVAHHFYRDFKPKITLLFMFLLTKLCLLYWHEGVTLSHLSLRINFVVAINYTFIIASVFIALTLPFSYSPTIALLPTIVLRPLLTLMFPFTVSITPLLSLSPINFAITFPFLFPLLVFVILFLPWGGNRGGASGWKLWRHQSVVFHRIRGDFHYLWSL